MKNPIPICCWPAAILDLAKGLLYGWLLVQFERKECRWLFWKCWYWPGFLHPWRYDLPCKHDREQKQS